MPASRAPLSATAIVYEAPEGCPTQADFEGRVRSRMPARESSATSPRRIEARLSRSGSRVSARVVLTDANGAVTTRRIVAASCNEAVDGLALIVALTVDPLEAHGGTTPPAQSAEPDGSPPSNGVEPTHGEDGQSAQSEPQTTASEPREASPAPKEDAASAREPDATAAEDASEPVTPSSSRRWRFGVSASFLAASGVEPALSAGGEFGVVGSTTLVPALSLRLGGRLVGSASATSADGSASFTWWSTFAAACLGNDAGAAFVLSGCAVYELGQIHAAGNRTQNPASSASLWQALGPELRFEWAFAAPLALGVAVAGMFPLREERFFLGKDVVYRVPTAGIRTEIGAAVRF